MNKRDQKAVARFRAAYPDTEGESPSERADLFCYYIKNSPRTEDRLYRLFKTKFFKSLCQSQDAAVEASSSASSSFAVSPFLKESAQAALTQGAQPNALILQQMQAEADSASRKQGMVQAGLLTLGLAASALLYLRK